MEIGSKDQKYIFGAYLNMARDNFSNTIELMAGKIYHHMDSRIEDKNEMEILDDVFGNVSYANLENVVEFYFPWIKALRSPAGLDNGDADLNVMKAFYKSVLRSFFCLVDSLRNEYTHYDHEQVNFGNIKIESVSSAGHRYVCGILNALDKIYDSAVNLAKQRFMADESEVAHLRRYKAVKGKVVRRTVKDKFYYVLSENNNLTEKGLAFVISLFLNRKYGFIFLKALGGFKRSDERSYRMTLETFLAFSNIKPYDRLKSEKMDRASLGLGILNELSKIPKELSDTLSFDYINNYLDTQDEEDVKSRIRYRDRFVPLTLEFISQSDEFKDFMFYTYMGNYVYKGYMKELIDGSSKERYLTDCICGFCRSLNDVSSDYIAEKYNVKIKDSNEPGYTLTDAFEPHILRAKPHFIINNNNIGIKIYDEDRDYNPVISEKGIKCPEPDFWMSIYELPAMLFYAYIRSRREYRNRCIYSVKELVKMSIKSQKDEKKNCEDKESLMLRRVKKEIIWTQSRLDEIKRINESNSAYGKMGHSTLKPGKMADVLSHDIIHLQPAEKSSDKLTGANFQAMQASLAYYRHDILEEVFKRAMLTTGNHEHPFLKKIKLSDCSTLYDFYVTYLKERKIYFDNIERKIYQGKLNTPCHILRRLQKDDNTYQTVGDVPVFLPRGIFTDAIKEFMMKTKLNADIKNARTGKNPSINAAYLILMFYNKIEKGGFQDFYNQPRRYAYFEKNMRLTSEEKKKGKYMSLDERKSALLSLKPQRISTTKANEYISKEEHLSRKGYKEVCDNEATIRMYQIQDILLLFMAKNIFSDVFKDVNSENIGLDKLENLFSKVVSFSKTFENISLNADNVKLKDYGKICRLAVDYKFNSFKKAFHKVHPNHINWNYASYLEEEAAFENYRVCVVKYCHEIEHKIIEVLKLKRVNNTHFNFRKDLITPYNDKYSVFNSEESEFLIQARNMFMHSNYNDECVEYVYRKYFNGSLDDLLFAEKTYKHFVELYDKLKADINQKY